MARKPKTIGHVPQDFENWTELKEFESKSYGHWKLLCKDGEVWNSYKLISVKTRRGRSNLGFGYSKVENRLSRNTDTKWLFDNFPELLEELTSFIVEGI